MQVYSSISGIPFYAPSAGYAPTNGSDVSAIASAYQVVSATATQLNAGTAYVTSINETQLSAARAGNAANATLATSAWYDGTGRLISSLPDSAAVSGIASAYAESAASGKEDAITYGYDTSNAISSINGSALAGGGGGGGGVDSATVSAIASSYAESAVSSKLDESATADFYSTSNPSGFISGVNLDGYATTSYVESSVSSKADSSALSSYALSAAVSGTVDLVSSQSANWGGSALALSAGPGVKFDKVGNTLVASTDETVLWSGNITASNGTGTLAHPPSAFDDLKIEWYGENTGEYGLKCSYFHNDGLNFSGLACGGIGQVYNNYAMGHHFGYLTLTNSTVTLVRQCRYNLTTTGLGAFESGNGMFRVQRIIGINRTAEA